MAKSEEITGVQKAAILLIALGPDKSSNVFKHLKEDEIEQLTLEIANTRSVSPAMKDAVQHPPLKDTLLFSYQDCLRFLQPLRPLHRPLQMPECQQPSGFLL